jgi:hypothetical protein
MRLGLKVQEEPGCGEPVNLDDLEEKTGAGTICVVSTFEKVGRGRGMDALRDLSWRRACQHLSLRARSGRLPFAMRQRVELHLKHEVHVVLVFLLAADSLSGRATNETPILVQVWDGVASQTSAGHFQNC